MKDEPKITVLPTGYEPSETIPRSEVQAIQQSIMILVDEIQLLSKTINTLVKSLRKGK